MDESFVQTLKDLAKTISCKLLLGGVGAHAVDDDCDRYYLVQWVNLPQELDEDEMIMVENKMMMVSKGGLVCQGKWYDRVECTKYWYTLSETTVTVQMKNVLHANLMLIPIGAANPLPCLHPMVWDHILLLHPEMLQSSNHDFMMEEIGCREMMSYNKDIINSDDEGCSDDNDDEDEEDNKDYDTNKE